MTRAFLIAIVIAAAFFLFGWKAAWFLAQDSCLDAGGRWGGQECEGLPVTG
ncbi:hypothetical protein [Erythrobacter aureus]|uniref:hypothetical protein n=1 Tax=Erythrobacter aureus TaxID=2182384 RepID=UPI001576B5AB|nr:hypothetical protein [Erythrobacter aureus]